MATMKKFYLLFVLFLLISCSCIHSGQRVLITNNNGENLVAWVYKPAHDKNGRLAFVQHGLASNANHQVIRKVRDAFLNNGYTVVVFDSRHSLGESSNDVENVRLSTMTEDLKTVILWAKTQPFYAEPFGLAGHSLGGASVLEYAAEYPQNVNILVPVTPVLDGNLWEKSCMDNMSEFCHSWKNRGFYRYTDPDNKKTASIPFAVVESSKSYDAYKLAPLIKAKILAIGADNDIVINHLDIKKFAESANNNGSYRSVKASGHNFESEQNQIDLYNTVNDFISVNTK